MFSGMITQLEGSCGVKLSEDHQVSHMRQLIFYPLPELSNSQMLKSVVEGVDETLFKEYSKPKSSILVQKVRDGILSKFDWYNAPQPSGERFCSLLIVFFFDKFLL